MKIKYSLAALLAITTLNAADNLGTISVESTTIDDRYDAKQLEVSNTTVINGNDIEDKHAENIADVLNEIPGLTVTMTEGDSGKIHIRGIAGEVYMGEKPGVAIVIDGVPVQERAGSVNIDSDNIKSIKVIKGGASYLYGNDALAGAVIITTKRPKEKKEGKISVEAGSFNYKKFLGNFKGGTKDYAVNLQASKKSSDGYWDNSDYWAKSINGKFRYYLNDSSDLTLGIDKSSRFENDTGSLTHTVNGVNQVETNPTSVGEVGYATEYDINLDKYFLKYSKDFDNDSNLMTQIYQYEDTTKNKSGAYDSDSDYVRDDHLATAFANTVQNGFKSEYRTKGKKIASMLGIDIGRNVEDKTSTDRVNDTYRGTTYTVGTLRSDTKSNEDINALYGEFKYKTTDKLTTSINARYDNINYDYKNNLTATSWNKSFDEISYKVGATYKLKGKSVLYTNTSTGFRVPTLAQMYAGDMSTSSYSGTYSNNTEIKTEKTYNYELGYRNKTQELSYDVALFQLNRKDVIGKNAGNYVGISGMNIQYDNMADIKNQGLELSLKSNKKKDFFYKVNYTYLDSKYTKYDEYKLILDSNGASNGGDYIEGTYDLAGNTVPRTSKHTVYIEGNYKLQANLLLTAGINYKSSQYADELNRVKIDGYSVVNLKTKYKTKIAGFQAELFAKINNALDEQYYLMPRATGDRNDDGVYNIGDMGLSVHPGRSYLAGLSVKF